MYTNAQEYSLSGNTFNRQQVNIEEIIAMVDLVESNPLKSIWSDTVFETEKAWRADVPRYLDTNSSRMFYFLLETKHSTKYCTYCNVELSIKSFNHIGWNKGFSKYCPDCTTNGVWRRNQTEEQLCSRGKKITEAKLKFYQTEYGEQVAKTIGIKNSTSLKKFFQTPKGKENIEKSRIVNSKIMKEKILNGEFTPNSNNRNTHWDSEYRGKKYRSSWEAIYHYFYPEDQYETLRIEYEYNAVNKIYIIDFINYDTRIVTEVKPIELCDSPQFVAKYSALQQWGIENDFTVRIADKGFLLQHGIPYDLDNFDKNTQRRIIKLHE